MRQRPLPTLRRRARHRAAFIQPGKPTQNTSGHNCETIEDGCIDYICGGGGVVTVAVDFTFDEPYDGQLSQRQTARKTRMSRTTHVGLIFAASLASCNGSGGSANPATSSALESATASQQEVKSVRDAYFAYEYDFCIAAAAESDEPGAWAWGTACAVARQPQELELAQQLLNRHGAPGDWAWFSSAALSTAGPEVFGHAPLPPVKTTLPDLVWMSAWAGTPRPEFSGEMPVRWRARIRVGELGRSAADLTKDKTAMSAALAEVKALHRQGDEPARTHALEAVLHVASGDYARAVVSSRAAIAKLPGAVELRQRLWRMLAERPGAADAREDLELDIAEYRRRGTSAPAEWAATYRFDNVGMHEQAEAARATIMQRWPNSAAAEWVRVERRRSAFRRAVRLPVHTPERAAADDNHEKLALEALGAESHNPVLRAETLHARLMLELNSRPATTERASRLIDEFLASTAHRPKRWVTAARASARAGVGRKSTMRLVKGGRDRLTELAVDDPALAARFDLVEASVSIKSDDMPAAEQLVSRSAKALEEDDRDLLMVRAELAIARGNDDPLALEKCASDKRCREMMEASFVPKPDLETFDAALDTVLAEAARLRQSLVLSRAAKTPRMIPAASLKRVGGGDDAELRWSDGVTILKFVEAGCQACAAEAESLQPLADTVGSDGRLLVLAAHGSPSVVAEEVASAGYKGPVFVAKDGFAMSQGVAAFPTTWFVDAEGRVRFEVVGRSAHLVQEYMWRLQYLLGVP